MRGRRGGALLAATVATTLAARGFWGCASDAPSAPAIESDATLTPVDAGRDTNKPEAEASPPEPGPPEGWVPWNDFSPTCSLYVPSSREYLPPPLEWEPCFDTPVTQKLACRRIKKKWEGGHNPDPKGIMRDTQLKEPYGIADDEFPSQEEFCILAKKYELCAFDKKTGELVGCCVYEEGPPHEEEKDEGKEDRGKEGTKPVRHDGANSSSSNIRYPWKPPGASLPTGPRLFEKLPKHP